MKYKNIVFDYGNVIAKFDGLAILRSFCESQEDADLLRDIVYRQWPDLDRGTLDYDDYLKSTLELTPPRLQDTVRTFFRDWPKEVTHLPDTLAFIKELNERQIPIYLLSNAPTYFADYMADSELLKSFNGVVFSGPIKMAKPDLTIYEYFFKHFNLKPEECFFIDDLPQNIEGAKNAGMDGIVFTGNIDEVKKQIEF